MTQKVTILGGGLAGLTTAYNLTNPDQLGRYDVTIYQHGWRLGGKCATGRNEEEGNRIQEHGLHVFMGQYDNAFHMVQQLYSEAANAPFDDWRKGFTQEPNVALMEKIGDEWIPWQVPAPIMPGIPGEGEPPDIWVRIVQFIEWMIDQIFDIHDHHFRRKSSTWLERALGWILSLFGRAAYDVGRELIKIIRAILHDLGTDSAEHTFQDHQRLAKSLKDFRGWVQSHAAPHLDINHDFRRAMVLIELGLATLIGGLEDGLFYDADAHLDRVNQIDYKQWLRNHGANEFAVESALIRSLYDLIFAYPEGNWTGDGNTEAGTMFLSLMNTARYRGSILWKFNTATGDLIMQPMYEVLKARGVTFKFFARVDELIPAKDGNWIDTVKIGQQVKVKGGEYDPLRILPSGQRVWPDRPLYDRIEQGHKLKKSGADLESRWTTWKDLGKPISLKMGKDFDWLVLAIPPGAHPVICKKLMEARPDWKAMVNNIQTTATQSIQTWMSKNQTQMGWTGASVVGGYDKIGLDTWADISEVLPTETWPASRGIVSEQIACGPLPCPKFPPLKTDTTYPVKAYETVKANAKSFLANDAQLFWPHAFGPGEANTVDSLYIRPNVDPSERYTLTVTGSSQFRFKTNESGYDNLILAGDWINNGQNQGSFEATTVSGMLASKALSGLPKNIFRVDADKLIAPSSNIQKQGAKPAFVKHGGMTTFPGPIHFSNMVMTTFLLEADHGKMQQFCKEIFTDPSGGEVHVLPLTSHMMMTIADIKKGVFSEAEYMGWSQERELAFWIPAVRVKTVNGQLKATHFNFIMPYLGLDNPTAIASGREIFGYWKQRGWISLPGEDNSDGFSVDLFSTKMFGAETMEARNPWVTLDPAGQKKSKILASIQSMDDGVKALYKYLEAENGGWMPGLGFDLKMLGELMTGHVPQLFLKQFRDIENGNKACYQAITEATGRVTAFKSLPDFHLYDMTIHQLDSSPVATEFGINPNQKNLLGVKLTFDLEIPPGKVVWQA